MLAAYQWGIFAIALGTFGIGTTEFMPMGLLPVIAEGVNASIPAAGLLISAYAVGVMVGAPLITLYLTKYSHKTSLLALMAVFVVGNLLSAMSVNYETFLVSRIITSLSHGAFFGIGAVVAMNLAPYHKKGSAVASIFGTHHCEYCRCTNYYVVRANLRLASFLCRHCSTRYRGDFGY